MPLMVEAQFHSIFFGRCFQDYGAYFAWDGETILGNLKLANVNCITRSFIHKFANSSLDCTVLTDEKDEQNIALLWHSD